MDEGRGEYLVAENLDVGKHNVKLVKQSHVAHNISTLLSLKMKGELIDAPADKDLLIEFVGDSITCGYGVVNYPTAGVKSYGTADYTDASQAYAYKTAELLDADYSMISVSGWTLISGDVSVPEKVYNYTSYRRSATEVYTPQRAADVVVINLGTNDIGREDYADKYIPEAKEFVSAVREKNPNAVVVFAYGMMMGGETLKGFEADVQTIVRDLGASNAGVFAVKLPTNQDAGNGHPSVEGHTEAAEILADFIKKNCL
jgi:lysophospholipase L1-like esterase